MTPRSSAIREKNREAVRKCRANKKEQIAALGARAEVLEKENAQMRMRLELGDSGAREASVSKGRLMVEQMRKLLVQVIAQERPDLAATTDFSRRKAPPLVRQLPPPSRGETSSSSTAPTKKRNRSATKTAREELADLSSTFFDRHVEGGRDRQTAIQYVLRRLRLLCQPDPTTELYLSLLSKGETQHDFMKTGVLTKENEVWRTLCSELELSEWQQSMLRNRTGTGRRTLAEVHYIANRVRLIHRSIARNKSISDSFSRLATFVEPDQFCRFILWCKSDPGCSDLLSMLWRNLMRECDVYLDDRDRIGDADFEALQGLLTKVRTENLKIIKNLFESVSPNHVRQLARRVFDPLVVIVDPNNGGSFKGLDAAVSYIQRMKNAFKPSDEASAEAAPSVGPGKRMTMHEIDMVVAGDRARAKYNLTGLYRGKLSKTEKRVSVNCVVSVTFGKGSDQILEFVVGLDHFAFVQQISSAAMPPTGRAQELNASGHRTGTHATESQDPLARLF